jgi:DNA-binding CsgD family transcriptional regulator
MWEDLAKLHIPSISFGVRFPSVPDVNSSEHRISLHQRAFRIFRDCGIISPRMAQSAPLTDREKEIVKLVVRGCRPEVALQIMVGFRGRLPLSPRETEIVQLVAQGCCNSDIAQKLSISECTVKIHLGHIFRKLGVCNREALAAFRI